MKIGFEDITAVGTYYLPYDYINEIAKDIAEISKENGIEPEIVVEKFRHVLTGRNDSSYFCETFKAELALLGNVSIVSEAEENGYLDGVSISEPEEIDIRIREYLLDFHKSEILYFAKQI